MKTLFWLVENFGALILFQSINHFYGLKPAILGSLVFAISELIYLKIKHRSLSPFFKFTFCIVMIFGVLDLTLESAYFIRYESVVLNLLTASYFGISLFRQRSLVEDLALKQGRITDEITPDKTFFFRVLTMVWFGYFILKSIVYFYVSMNSSIQDAFIIRTILGSVSFYLLLGILIGLSEQLWNLFLKMKWMPSARMNS